MKEKGGENGVTRGWLHSGGRSTSVAAAATSTLIGLTSYHLRERNVMNSRFVGSTAKISRECPLPHDSFFFSLFFLLAPFRTGNRRPLTYRSSVAFFFSRIIIYRSLIVPFFLSFFEKKAVSLSPFFQEYKKNWRKTRRGRRSFRTPGVFIICKWRRAFLFHPPASAKRALFFKRFPRVLIPSRAANNFQPTRNYALRRASSRILSTCIL